MTSSRAVQRFVIALSAFSIYLTLAGCSHKRDTGYEGYVEGKFVYVASSQSGRLERLAVTRGETVNISHPLFALEREPEAAGVLQAQQILRADKSRLADIQSGKRPAELDVIRAQLSQAKIESQKSLALLKSYEEQLAGGGVPLTDVITARAAAASSETIVRQYESDLAVAELPGRDQQLRAQADVIAADQATLQQSEWRLRQKQVVSPGGGLVFDTLYREGEWVSAGSPVIQLLPPENIEVRFFVPETLVGSLTLGQKVVVHCDGCPPALSAAITFISNQVEYTPPVIYSNENRAKLVFMVIAKPPADKASLFHPGQPLEVTLQ
jgi:HlyD family secretion protein